MLPAKHSRVEIASAQRDSPVGARERALSVLRAAASTRLCTLVRRNPVVEMPPLPRLVAAREVATKISGFTWPRFVELAGRSTRVGCRLPPSWDRAERLSASFMGPPGLPVMGPLGASR